MLFAAKPRRLGIANRRQEILRNWGAQTAEGNDTRRDFEHNPFTVGDLVYLKCDSRCDRPWSGPHHVTGLHSRVSVLLDEERVHGTFHTFAYASCAVKCQRSLFSDDD